ncbi:hypothetical protein JYU34_012457 [Plutella xylostella]|uniref:unspecific monooxygenase n=1 Tax=Plutella xylostella TaxID=51655 RepID=A0ABQ7QCQ5_PLUXY|nr:probable cytochrome P450 9f2 [Plutella xylostella]KAG7302539.1 hypothetical protein JYU34_012457 [Plutella xylostella]
MIAEILIFILTTLVAFAFYSYYKNQNVFKSKDMKFLPGFPMFGNIIKSSFGKNHMFYDLDRVYRAFPGESYVGYVEGFVPLYLIRDPSIIRLITVKDFDHFVDHRRFATDDLFNESLFMMTGDRWRDMRSTLSPAFTGSKMRQMVPFMNETSNNIVHYLRETEGQDIDASRLIRCYTNDVIASTIFGLQVNSLKDPENDFYKAGQSLVVGNSLTRRLSFFIVMTIPALSKFFPFFPKETTDFFRGIVLKTMQHRENNNIERPDMIQMLMEAAKGTLKMQTHDKLDDIGFATTDEADIKPKGEMRQWTPDTLAAQAFLFFFGGFESSASVIVMAVHELAVNPEAQGKLYEEVKEYHEKHGKMTYEGVQKMTYLDCVANEALRKWSPAVITNRVCVKPYVLPPPREGGKPVQLEVGDGIYNSVSSVHWDEQYYPEPEKFKPERFNDENKHKIQPFTFMPFGTGPRNCIASRFAILELKVLLYHIVLNFEIQKCGKTSDPVQLAPGDFNIRAVGGSWVKFSSRN